MLETLRALLLKLKLAPASAIARPTESSELESSESHAADSLRGEAIAIEVSSTQRYMDDFAAECFYEDYEDLE